MVIQERVGLDDLDIFKYGGNNKQMAKMDRFFALQANLLLRSMSAGKIMISILSL